MPPRARRTMACAGAANISSSPTSRAPIGPTRRSCARRPSSPASARIAPTSWCGAGTSCRLGPRPPRSSARWRAACRSASRPIARSRSAGAPRRAAACRSRPRHGRGGGLLQAAARALSGRAGEARHRARAHAVRRRLGRRRAGRQGRRHAGLLAQPHGTAGARWRHARLSWKRRCGRCWSWSDAVDRAETRLLALETPRLRARSRPAGAQLRRDARALRRRSASRCGRI